MALTRKPIPLDAWHLSDQSAMLAALSDLSAAGWRGGISMVGGAWRLELNADQPTRQVIAETGDWLVDDFGLRRVTAAECTANYDEAE